MNISVIFLSQKNKILARVSGDFTGLQHHRSVMGGWVWLGGGSGGGAQHITALGQVFSFMEKEEHRRNEPWKQRNPFEGRSTSQSPSNLLKARRHDSSWSHRLWGI